MDRKRVFIVSEDAELAVRLVRLLDGNGVTAFWLTEEQGEKLEQLWWMDACIKEVEGNGSVGGRQKLTVAGCQISLPKTRCPDRRI